MVANMRIRRGQVEDVMNFLITVIFLFLALWFMIQIINGIRIKTSKIYMTTYRYGDLELKANPPLYVIHTDKTQLPCPSSDTYKTTPELLALAVASKGEEYEWYTGTYPLERKINVKEIVEGLYNEDLKRLRYKGKVTYHGEPIFEFGPGGEFGVKTTIWLPSVYNSISPYFNLTIIT